MKDLYGALCWIRQNHKLFHGKVTEPAVLKMQAEDQHEALQDVLIERTLLCLFFREDMDIFSLIVLRG